jgi:hypothetical protein
MKYHVLKLFPTREGAQAYIDKLELSGAEIKEKMTDLEWGGSKSFAVVLDHESWLEHFNG